jgi:choline dehydrogenase-like flavoprotein
LIEELDRLDDEAPREADVCIVGAGAAGMTIAAELDGCGARVLVLESGGRAFDQHTQDLYRSHVVGLPHAGVHDLRYRVFGGSTTRWAGQALPLAEIDFARRDWVPHSGWPFDSAELTPFYRRASEAMRIRPFPPESEARAWPATLPPPPGFDSSLLRSRFSQFSPTPNFAHLHGRRLEASDNVDVLLGANVIELVPDPGATALDTLTARSLRGRRIEVRALCFVLCAGGLEVPRLLLSSDRRCEGGIGNGHDLVGRCFQDHPGLEIGTISPTDPKLLSRTFRPRRDGSERFFPFFTAAEQLQRSERLLNAAGTVQLGGEATSVVAAKTLLRAVRRSEFTAAARAEAPSALGVLLRDPLPALRAVRRHFILRQPTFETAGVPVLTTGGEQEPNPQSRVSLADERDALGMRRLVLDWRVSERDLRSWRRLAEVVATEFERLDLGSVDLDMEKLPDDPDRIEGLVDAGHHMGTTRMAADPRQGVVDADCRVHGIENLFIASSAVFPTGGFSNPTYTIVALALRLADRLKATVGAAAGITVEPPAQPTA